MGTKGSPWMGGLILSLMVALAITGGLKISIADDGPKGFKYYHLWTSQDGETHIKTCKMGNFTLQPYSASPQYQVTDFGGPPTKMVFMELPTGLKQPLHSPPNVQFVITLANSWYIITTDGSRRALKQGDVLFQDNTVNSPADKVPQHYSGNIGNKPGRQYVVQFNRTAEVDNPCPF